MVEPVHAASHRPARAETSQLNARAAVLPLAAIMVCSRLCPIAGLAGARIIRRLPKQIRPTTAPHPNIARSFTHAAGSAPGRTLGTALARSAQRAATLRAQGFNAHHIVAVRDSRGEFARMVLAARGIQPNSAVNGVWLHRTVHAPIHTNAYFANVNTVLGKNYFQSWRPTSELVADLARVGRLLQKGQLPL